MNNHPWQPASTAQEDGTLCELRFRDVLGLYDDVGPFVLHEGRWYRVDPPTEMLRVVCWRPGA